MTRTRMTFFIILAVAMSIVALSLGLQLIQTGTILQIYIACAIFAGGIVILDFIGILGHDSADGGGDAGGDLSVDGDMSIDDVGFDGTIDGDASGDFAVDGAIDGLVDGPGSHIEGTGFDAGDSSHGHTAGHIVESHLSDIDSERGSRVLMILAYLRMTVYFCLGFGPTGWAAVVSGYHPLIGLVLAIVVGVIALFLAQTFFRFQRSSTDSSISSTDLLRSEATVTIPLTHKTMGKVRIQVGMSVTEQYALAVNEAAEFNKGEQVHIMRVTDECVYVA